MAANLFEHPWVIVIIAAVALIRWFLQAKPAAGETEAPPPPPSQPIPRGSETQTEEERIRRFLEALGRPAGATPPKEVKPRRRQVVPQIFPTLPPLTSSPPPLPAKPSIRAATPPPLPVELAIPHELSKLEAGFEVRDVVEQTSSEPPETLRTAGRRFDPRIKLGTPQDLRTAIVLREVFGPPRSMQPIDLTSS
jgi:hypothetical protein